ncbi:MAG: RND family transporter, partial [Opitutaceae bacterium]
MKATIARFSDWIFHHRAPLVIVFGLFTVVIGWFAAHLKIDASFNKGIPLEHPYVRTFTKYQNEFGGANRVMIALMARQGDIFTPGFFQQLKQVTDDAFFLPGVDRAQVQSLFTPNVRYTEVVEDGFSGGNVIPPDFQPTPEGLARVRQNVIKSGKIGQLVANDFSGAIVSAQLQEVDPATGKKLDYLRVAGALEGIRRRVER